MNWQPSNLPYSYDMESRAVLKALTTAHQALGQLKGLAKNKDPKGKAPEYVQHDNPVAAVTV